MKRLRKSQRSELEEITVPRPCSQRQLLLETVFASRK
jgi:hypothetical protein